MSDRRPEKTLTPDERFPWWPDDWFCLDHGARGSANRCRLKKYMPQVSECHMVEVFIAPKSDSVAVVRRGVESGTIKGKQTEHYCVAHEGRVWAYPDVTECAFQLNQRAGLGQPTETPCDLQRVLVIPVSDGGSET